jgi:integrase
MGILMDFGSVKWCSEGMAKARKNEWPRTVSYGAGRVRIARRANGWFAIHWRECGGTTEEGALEFAQAKARALDAGETTRYVSAGEAESLAALRSMAGTEDGAMRRLLEDVRGARKWLEGGTADLTAACRWFAEFGPLRVQRVTVAEARERFLQEYEDGSRETARTFGQELRLFRDGDLPLVELSEERLKAWVTRAVGGKPPAPRTLRNRITTWVTFLNRCRDWHLLSPGKHAGEKLRKPKIPDAGKEILSVEEARRLLSTVREHEPRLEAYLLIGGWLGLRPSEIQRLRWNAFDWARGYCHVSVEVAGKTKQERYIPVEAGVLARLREIFRASGKKASALCCAWRAREYLSRLARTKGGLARWPADVLRHSFCSYRVCITQSLAQVATEAGNSPQILASHYRRPLRKEDGVAWWGLVAETQDYKTQDRRLEPLTLALSPQAGRGDMTSDS